jgi:hypothetical protein
MQKIDKVFVAVFVAAFVICGVIVISGVHSTIAPRGFVVNGNFTVQDQTKIEAGTSYLLVWHGGNGTAQINAANSYVYTEVSVSDGKNVTVTVNSSPVTLFENYTKLFTLNP